ncbi:MAG TPA: shikimate dehydrogenase [Allosphingosinicella sp.]|nr:shikimate dehydrogenase [Allosphingosinicella sp.]
MGVPYAELVGDPVAHSKSPAIHGFWLEKLGIEGDYRVARVTARDMPGYFAGRRGDPDWRGCNVTMPLKQAVLPFMGRLDQSAEKCGAVNTVVREPDGSRKGHNTDMLAVARLLEGFERRPYRNKVATYVQIIGAGGAARAAALAAVRAGYCDFDFFNRSVERAEVMALWFGLDARAYAAPLEGLGPIRNPDDGPDDQRYSHVVVNATSLGMEGKPDLAIDLSRYYPDTIVIDLPYGPRETALVRQARALGLRVADGLDVLIEQAALAFALFFGAGAPREHDGELRDLLR